MTARCSTLAAGPSSPTYRATATSRRASEKTASGSSGQSLLTWLTPAGVAGAVAVEVAAVVEDVARAVVVEAVELRDAPVLAPRPWRAMLDTSHEEIAMRQGTHSHMKTHTLSHTLSRVSSQTHTFALAPTHTLTHTHFYPFRCPYTLT